MLEDRQVADAPGLGVMNLIAPAQATAAAAWLSGLNPQSQYAPGAAPALLQGIRVHLVSFPASQPGNTLIQGHGRPPAFLLCGNNKLAVTTVRPLSIPLIGEEPKISVALRGS